MFNVPIAVVQEFNDGTERQGIIVGSRDRLIGTDAQGIPVYHTQLAVVWNNEEDANGDLSPVYPAVDYVNASDVGSLGIIGLEDDEEEEEEEEQESEEESQG